MAKTKKQSMSPEERLTQALVPERERPYKVPRNWVWVRLGNIVEVIMGQSPKGNETTDDKSYTGLIGGATDMGEFSPNISRYTMKPTKLSKTDDVIISIRATLGHPVICDGEYCLGRGVAALRSSTISNRLIRFFMINSEEHLHKVATGTTFVQVSKIDLEQMMFPLPPLPEQQRIVNRIESLFEKLDRAKELAQNALDSFETRKAAILHKAFTGELTAKWREENGVGMESWESKKLKELGTFKLGKMLDQAKNKGEPIGYLRNINVRWFSFDLDDIALMAATDDDKKKFSVAFADLFICEGGEPGRCAVWEQQNCDLIYQKALHRFRSNALVISKILACYLFFINKSNGLVQYFTGTTIKHLTGQSLAEIDINLPSLSEQQEIVRILDNLFEKEQRTRDLCDVIEKIELMKKTILAKAFRGELGTNEPSEENLMNLSLMKTFQVTQ